MSFHPVSASDRYNGSDIAHREKILVTGGRKSGKSSCIKSVFQNLPVKDVTYIGITKKVEKIDYDTIVPLQIYDTPASLDLDQLDVPLSAFSTLVYVVDMQQEDTYHEAVRQAAHIILRGYFANPAMNFFVFIHKAESLSEDYRDENYSEIQRALTDELDDFHYMSLQDYTTLDLCDRETTISIFNHLTSEIKYDMTSVHDVSLRDAWGKVVQGIMEMLPAVEALLLNFTETSGMDNSYLFDLRSRVVLATDNRHRNEATMEQVVDYLSTFLQFREFYKVLRSPPALQSPDTEVVGKDEDASVDKDEDASEPRQWWEGEDTDEAWMTHSIQLMPKCTITLWQFTPQLALVALLHTDTWNARRGMIEYNLTFLRQGVRRILIEAEL